MIFPSEIKSERNQKMGVKSKMRKSKLRRCVNWQGALKEKGRKTNGRKTRTVYIYILGE